MVPLLGVSNKLMSCVRPGVFDTLASCLRLASALMSDDLPTFERPTKATSTGDSGNVDMFDAEVTKAICSGEVTCLVYASIFRLFLMA